MLFEIPEDLKDYLEVEDCSNFNEARYFITEDIITLYKTITDNHKLAKKVHKLGFPYLNTTLLFGRPGTGKTHFAKYLAYKQKMPFVYINFAQMMGASGEANKAIKKIFRFMSDKSCVFMLDEIDCIARRRSDESGDNSIVLSGNTISLMQELDYYKSHDSESIILGATNRQDILDEALLSRFALKHQMIPLNNEEKLIYLLNSLDSKNLPYDEDQVRNYCNMNSRLEQRSMEADMIQSIVNWLAAGEKGNIVIKHIK